MARRYQRKNPLRPPREYEIKIVKKRDGHWYMEYRVALDVQNNVVHFHTYAAIPAAWKLARDYLRQGRVEYFRTEYGQKSGRKHKVERRNELVWQTYQEAMARKVHRAMIPDLINGKLKMYRFPQLSDSRIRAIIASKKPS